MTDKSRRIKLHRHFSLARRGLTVSTEPLEHSDTYKVKPDINLKHRQRILNLMKAKVSKLKLKEFRNKIHPEYLKIPQVGTTREEMWMFADQLPTTPINKYVVRDILKRAGMKEQQNKFKEIVKSVTKEFSDEFVEITHVAGVQFRVKPIDGSEPHLTLKPYKFKGKTANYPVFLCNRNTLQKQLCLHYPLMRKILSFSSELPTLLIDFSEFRERAFEIHSLRFNFLESFNKRFEVLKNFYTSINKCNNIYRRPKSTEKYFSAANTLITIIITTILRSTISHMIEIINDDERIPFMQLHLYYKNDFELTPTAEDVFELYEEMVYKICKCAEAFEKLGGRQQCLQVYIQSEFLEESFEKIWMILYTKYHAIDAHVKKIECSFSELHGRSVEDYKKDLTFESGMLEVAFYRNLILKVDDIYLNESYYIGVLEQGYCKTSLKRVMLNYIRVIGAKLGRQHEWENEDICRTFQNLAARAEEVPKTSQELIDKGTYMATASNDILEDLDARIIITISQIPALMEITVLSREHMRLNASSINWATRIKPIIESNAKLYENYKFDFEERLVNEVAQLNDDITAIIPYLSILNSMNDAKRAKEYVHQMSNILVKIRNCEMKKEWINSEEKIFKYPISQFIDLEEVKAWIYNFYHLLKLCINWNRYLNAWMDGPFEFLIPADSEKIVCEYEKELSVMQKNYRNQLKQMAADNNPRRFQGSVDDPDPLNQPAPLQLCRQILESIKGFKPSLKIMSIVCNPALLQRHWDEMSEIAGFDMTPNAGTTLRKIIAMDLSSNMEGYEIISAGAVKELQLITNLKKMIAEWDEIDFKTSCYKDTSLKVLVGLEDIQVILDDHTIKTLTMRGSVFVKPYEKQVKEWYDVITCISSTIEAWKVVQNKWLKLVPIFASADIKQQMPNEAKLFDKVDNTYNAHMRAIEDNPNVLKSAGGDDLFKTLALCLCDLEAIAEGVNKYLERKRLFFPRFFFLSNEEMLGILSETKNPVKVAPNLRNCFDGVHKFEFNSNLEIVSIVSCLQEVVVLSKSINTKEAGGSVEIWLHYLEVNICETLHTLIFNAKRNYLTADKCAWMLTWPQQVVIVVTYMYFTANVHAALRRKPKFTIVDLKDNINSDLDKMLTLLRNELTNSNKLTVKSLIIIHMHLKHLLAVLVARNITTDCDFVWMSTLKYYWEESTKIRLLNAKMNYANEYLGNYNKLVITPLTERCFISLISAQNHHLNASLVGTASSGKTETVKDLAKALGIRCIIFNCSQRINYTIFRNFLKGAAASETWICFDHFNSVELEVMSVLSQQIRTISQSLKNKLGFMNFNGANLNLSSNTFICLTMNAESNLNNALPDNLAVYFRTIAMMVPDFVVIAQVVLASHGFRKASELGRKIYLTYNLCTQQLSNQNHYDFSLRSIKTVLEICGDHNFTCEESTVVAQAISKVITPTLVSEDVTTFELILKDVFESTDFSHKKEYDLSKILEEANLQPNERLVDKVCMVDEIRKYKHGIILVGEAFTGKSTVVKLLAESVNNGGVGKVEYKYINPRCVTIKQFYGEINPKTNEWVDGIFAQTFRAFSSSTEKSSKWIILDGPIDPLVAENMNLVLDDNRKLCLTSGEIISFAEQMIIIFEVEDLSQASPSMISRCGIIYFEANTLHWKNIVDSWKQRQTMDWYHANSAMISAYLYWIVEPCLEFIQKQCQQICNIGQHNLVKSVCDLIEMIMNDACSEGNRKDEDVKYIIPWMQATVISAGIWGFGANLEKTSRKQFDVFYRSLWKNENKNHKYPLGIPKLEMLLPPTEGLLSDYYYLYKAKGSWKFWQETLRNQRIEDAENVQNTLIPTVETAKYGNLVQKHIAYNKKMLLVGPSGAGKSFLIKDVFENKLNAGRYEASVLSFTIDTTANQTSELILSKLYKKKRGHFGPPSGKTSVMFIDDLNTLEVDVSRNQPALELLRYLFEHNTLYDLKDIYEIHLNNLLFISAMRSTRNYSQRFLRHFNVFYMDDISEDSVSKIFNNNLYLAYKNAGFQNEANNAVSAIVAATLDVYKCALEKLLPTPNKSHYMFNIRDFAKVVLGCSLLKRESTEDKRIFAKVWIHETLRVFHDRLTEQSDRELLFWEVKHATEEHFKENVETIFEDLITEGEEVQNVDDLVYFADFTNSGGYEEISKEKMLEVASSCLKEYNVEKQIGLDLVFFEWALKHLGRISRILKIPSTSGLLIGMHGLGRQSLTRLATFMAKYSFFQPEITRGYNLKQWREDLREVLKESGGRGKNTTFLVSDHQILDPIFLQDIDSLLNIGEVPNMFAMNAKQEILEMVRLDAQGGNRNLDITATTVFTYFIKRCKEKLHIIFCLSPINKNYRKWLRVYPALINNCVIDYFNEWPEDSLEAVANEWISSVELDEGIKAKALSVCKNFHAKAKLISEEFYLQTSMRTYITISTYMELVKSFKYLFISKQEEIRVNKNRYMAGLEKLQTAENAVATMQKDLAEFQPQLQEMTNRAAEMTKQIAKETIEVEKASAIVREDEKLANIQAANSQYLKRECEADLADAIPILEDAIEALNTLKPSDITLVKSMKNPPEAVKLVMAGVCVMRDIKPDRINDASTGGKILDYWGPSKRLLGDMNFLQHLKDFDKDHIKLEIMAKIRKEYLPNKLFKPNIVAKASSAAEGLCKWIIAMDMYDAVAKEVAPKKEKLELAEKEYQTTAAFLMEKKQQLAKLEEKLANLNEALDEARAKQKELQDNVDICANKLLRAEKLLTSLSGEKVKWIKANDSLQDLLDKLSGNILVCSGLVAYLSPYSYEFRMKYTAEFHACVREMDIPSSEEFEFCNVLGQEAKMQHWKMNSLPANIFSLQNALIQDVSARWSLLIDPECQGNIWLKKLEKFNGLLVTKFTNDYIETLEAGLKLGKPVLIENIFEDFAPALETLLDKHAKQIRFAKQLITPHENFRLYLTTKLRKPHYLPHVSNKLTLINFGIMLDGLKDQLLDLVVAKERPELQQQREELILKRARNESALVDVEENILKTLSESKGDILEDTTAIEALDNSKVLSLEIIENKKALKLEGESIEERRSVFRKVSTQSAFLYASITDLPNVNPMYQFGLEWFINLYIRSIESANKSKLLERRLRYLEETFMFNLYSTVCMALFEKDKLVFVFLLCCKIQIANGVINESEFRSILNSQVEDGAHDNTKRYDWITRVQWKQISALNIEGFVEDFIANEDEYRRFYDSEILPERWVKKLSGFQKLMLTKIFHVSKFYQKATEFIAEGIGLKFTQPPPFDLSKSYEASTCICPLIFILSPGDDPMNTLQTFSQQKRMSKMFHTISIGQQQQQLAVNMIKNAQEIGAWICLQNCHVDLNWLTDLERLVENINLTDTHTNFRLWITTHSTSAFPISILQSSVKITKQTPSELKEYLLETYTTPPLTNPEFFTACSAKEDQFAKLLYGITYFHHVIQTRLPMYAFKKTEYNISSLQLQKFINDFHKATFEAIPYLITECNYGGALTDCWDMRLLKTLFKDFFNSEMKFKFNNHGLPKRFSYEDYLEHIRTLSCTNKSTIYGVHENVTYLNDIKISNYLLDTIKLIQGEVSPNYTRDTAKALQEISCELHAKIISQANLTLAKCDDESEFNSILGQEIFKFQNLLSVIISSLNDIQSALKGNIQLNASLESLADSLIKSEVPKAWMHVGYLSKKALVQYADDLILRVKFFNAWAETGTPGIFWIASFFNPTAFLVTIKRNYSRKIGASVEEVMLNFEIVNDKEVNVSSEEIIDLKNSDQYSEECVLIHGLYLVGACWDRSAGKLDELQNNVFYDKMPVILVKPVLKDEFVTSGKYECPVFITSERSRCVNVSGLCDNFVTSVWLDTDHCVEHWVNRGVALLCQIE